MGMFDKDKEYGNRIDSAFKIGEPFLLLAAKMSGKKITTKLGESETAELLVMRLGRDGFPEGTEFTCATIASAIVEKVNDADDDDFPCIVELRHVTSTKWGTTALVLQFVSPYNQGSAARAAEAA